jgi:hypothetical protein
MILYFDIDGVLAKTNEGDYPNAKPMKTRIKRVNKLFKEGHQINIWTARGALSGINWLPFTQKQLESWGVQYHTLSLKPYFDLLVDDRALDDKSYFQ